MFQVSSGSGTTASLSYAIPFVYLAPKATITFTFGYGCANHYTATKVVDLRIPTTTISGTAISDGFVLDANAVVTVTGKVKSNEGARAIVPVGARLIIDGGCMTGNGAVMWSGIEVWGDKNANQYPVNGSYSQGYLELRNGAVVENAVCAVELWRTPDGGGTYWNTTGGIVHASDASFANNATAVHALCYTNTNPDNDREADYNAWFENCEFTVDGGYLGTEAFTKHVGLQDVRGVKFRGCDFSADRRVQGVSQWCMGVNAYDASFTISAFCDNNTNVQPCPPGDYDRSTLSGFHTGVRASSNGDCPRNFTVREAVFADNDIGVHATNTDFPLVLQNDFAVGNGDYCRTTYGVFLENVTSFCVEENVFSPSPHADGWTYGLAVYDSHGVNDVYLNRFSGLTCGNQAKGVNTAQSNALVPPGLTYSCNDNSGNQYDFVALPKEGAGGIQSQQGSSFIPAGNTFGASVYQFYNGCTAPLSYYYHSGDPDQTPDPSKLHGVGASGTAGANACHPHYGNGPVRKSPSETAALEAEYRSAYAAYFATHEDAYAHEYSLAAGDIVRSNLADSIADPAGLRLWLGNLTDIATDRMAVASHLHDGDSASAFALAKAIPGRYGLQGDDLDDHMGYVRLLEIYQALNRSARTVYQLTDAEKGVVEDIAGNGKGNSRSLAVALLEQIGDTPTRGCLESQLPEQHDRDWGGMVGKHSAAGGKEGLAVSVSPNPAANHVAVDYSLPASTAKAALEVTNALGVMVLSVELDGNQGRKTLDLGKLPPGVYTYTVWCGNNTVIGKLVIVH